MAKKKKRSNKIIYILIGVVVVVFVFAIIAKQAGWIGKKRELDVELSQAQEVTIIEKVSASGMVQPVKEISISPDVPGEITQLTVEEGDSITAGQLLVKIRPDNFINALERAKAQYNQQIANVYTAEANVTRAQATLDRAKREYDRNKKLHEDQVISDTEWLTIKQTYEVGEQDLVSARQNLKAAQYQRASAKASLDDAEENLELTSVYAPVSGSVSKLNVEEGERVVGTQQMAGTEMMRVADLNKMEVRVDVNENDIIRVAIGDTAIIDVDSYSFDDKEFKGIVTHIANTANDKISDDAVTEFRVRILILNESYADLTKERRFPFRPGMTASVDIITDKKDNVLSVPLSAVTTRKRSELMKNDSTSEEKPEVQKVSNDKNNKMNEDVEVIFINDDGIAKVVEVETGISDYDNIQILSGVEKDASVVSGPFLTISKRIKDGDAIKSEDMSEADSSESEEE